MYLLASKSKSGVLIIPGDEHEIIEDNGSSILIFGSDAPSTILEDWIKKRLDLKKRDKQKMDSKEP